MGASHQGTVNDPNFASQGTGALIVVAASPHVTLVGHRLVRFAPDKVERGNPAGGLVCDSG